MFRILDTMDCWGLAGCASVERSFVKFVKDINPGADSGGGSSYLFGRAFTLLGLRSAIERSSTLISSTWESIIIPASCVVPETSAVAGSVSMFCDASESMCCDSPFNNHGCINGRQNAHLSFYACQTNILCGHFFRFPVHRRVFEYSSLFSPPIVLSRTNGT